MGIITDNAHENTIHGITSQNNVMQIPLFQREYTWQDRQLKRMITEIEAITDRLDDNRFLGTIIAVKKLANPAQTTPNEIVDGQQRLSTMYLFIMSAAELAAKNGDVQYANSLVVANLIADWVQDTPNVLLSPAISDRQQLNNLFRRLFNIEELSWLSERTILLPDTGPSSGSLLKQYNRIYKYQERVINQLGLDRLKSLVEAVRHHLTFVYILLKDSGAATTVFEGLNDHGEPVSVGDLVKNEIFSREGYDDSKAIALHDNKWKPFRERFQDKKIFDGFFFPLTLIHKPAATRTEMFAELRILWKGKKASEIIEHLNEYVTPYLALTGDLASANTYGKDIEQCINRLNELKQPNATYPFLMPLLKAFNEKKIDKNNVLQCFHVLESFLVRRAICGIEPTGLLAIFRNMWANAEERPNSNRISQIISARKTVEWPSDKRLEEAIKQRPLYKSSILKHLLLEYDRSLSPDQPHIEKVNIEHIMPNSYVADWNDLPSSEHKKYKDLWANLILTTEVMNNNLGQKPFKDKSIILKNQSAFASSRLVGENFQSWNKNDIEARSQMLFEWARERWPKPSL